jgi:hypothetical protein
MADFSYLLGQKPLEVPTPLAVASQGLTLADLLQRTQAGGINLQAAQQAAAAAPEFAQGLASGADPDQLLASMATKYPYAYQKLLADYKASQLTQAQIGAQQAASAKDRAAAAKDAFGLASNYATSLMSSGQPPSAAQKMQLATQFAHASVVAGIDPAQVHVPSLIADDSTWAQFGAGVAGMGTPPKDAAEINKWKQTTPAEVAEKVAQANKANVEAGLAPFQAQTSRISAGAAAQQAGTQAAEFAFGKTYVPPLTGQGVQVQPQRDAQGNLVPVATPIGGAPAAPGQAPQPAPQLGMGAGQSAQLDALKKRLEEASANTAMGQRMESIVPGLRQMVASGYNGTLAGSQAGKDFLEFAGSVGALNQDQMTKLGNMRASDALTAELLGPLARELSTKGNVIALKVAINAKPSSENPAAVRMRMIDALQADAKTLQLQGQALNRYVGQNPGDLGLVGFVPPAPIVPTLSSIPMAAASALRADPSKRADFDAKYGTGAAATVLGK